MSIHESINPDDVIDSLVTSTPETDPRATWHIQKDIKRSKLADFLILNRYVLLDHKLGIISTIHYHKIISIQLASKQDS